MRLRLTVERNAHPAMNVVWNIDGGTISDLLHKVNEIIPIESSHWGFEDYAVELRGSHGVNFECLHFQEISKVFKDEDEVTIRPLLTHDMRVRRVSGRHQISEDGRRIYDGISYGRPLLMPPRDRPEIYIPPRKRARIMGSKEDEDEDGDEGIAALEQQLEKGPENLQQQVILHAGFENEDSEDDDDFAPEDENTDSDSSEDLEGSEGSGSSEKSADEIDFEEFTDEVDSGAEEDELATEVPKAILQSNRATSYEEACTAEDENVEYPPPHSVHLQDDDEVLAEIHDEADRLKLRKLRSAFPQASMTMCERVFLGAHGDMETSWAALILVFEPVLPKATVTETVQAPSNRSTPKKPSKLKEHSVSPAKVSSSKKRPAATMEENDNDLSEPSEDEQYTRWNTEGLPPGSISSGNALTVMAELVSGSSSRGRNSAGREPGSSRSNKIKFVDEETFSQGLTSTPFIDKDSLQEEDSSDADFSDDSSDESSESSNEDSKGVSVQTSRRVPIPQRNNFESSSSSEDDSSSSGSNQSKTVDAKRLSINEGRAPTSGSDSDSSSSDSSEDDMPEEVSSKDVTNSQEPDSAPKSRNTSPQKADPKHAIVAPFKGKTSTQKRNERRKISNAVDRYVKKGLLPAGTTSGELTRLDPDETKRLAEASAALDASGSPNFPMKHQEFELQRQKLLESIAAGGVEMGASSPKSPRRTESVQHSATRVAAQDLVKGIPDTMQISSSVAVDTHAEKCTEVSQMPDASTVIENPSHPLQSSPKGSQMNDSNLQEPPPPTKGIEVGVEEPLITFQPTNVDGDGNGQASLPESQKVASNTEQRRQSTTSDSIVDNSEADFIVPASADSSQAKAAQRRSRIDTSAGKRMLFGALGIKAPTNEKEANEARSKLIKGIRPTKELDRNTESSYSSSELQVESEDLTAWESVINYRAVECCRPGMPLTKPPFPFVQRWDPQQQRGNKRRTDHQRNASHYYEGAYSASNPKRRKGTHNYDAEAPDSLQYDDLVATSGAQDGDVEKEVGQQLQHENQTVQSEASQAPDDLVVLPNDPSTLPDLLDGVAQARMVIAFRQLEMSEATMWQPQMSPYKTAIVIDVLDDDRLDMLLAKRDRVRSEKLYDYDTGERIYGKFEMPVEIEDNDDDDGRLCLTFAELVEPKIVVGLTVEAVQDTNVNEISQPKDQPSRDESATLSHEVPSHEEEPTEAQFSHVTETVLDLDAQEPRSPKVDNTNDVEAKNPDSPDPQNQNSADLETSGRPDAETCPELSLDEAMDEIPEIVDSLPDAQLEITDMSVDALNGPSALQDEAEARIVAEQGTIPHISTVLEVSEASMIGAEEFSTTANAAETIAKNMPKSVAASIIGTEEEAECHRKEFSKHIKELGFRSTISSSTMRELRPNDMETPAAVVFIQTEQDMAEIEQGSSYSPTFNGFGTSPSSAENHKDSPSPAARQPSKFPQPSPKLPSKSPSSQVPKETSRSPKAVPQLSSGSSEPPQSSWQTVDEGNEDYWEDPDEDGDGMSSVDAAESEMESSDGEQNDIILDLETKDREFDIDMLTDVEKSARASPMNVEEFTAGELSRLQEPNRSARVASVSGASRCPEMRPTELQETSQKLRTRLVSWASESRNIASRSVPGALVTNPEPRATRSRSASRASSSRASEPGDSKSRSISRAPILRASEPRAAKTRSPSRASMSRASEQMESNSRSASRLSGIRASDHGDSRTKSVSRATALQASELVDSQSRSVSVSKVSDQIPTKSMSVSKPASRGSTSRGSPPPETSTKVSKTASSVRAAKSPSAQAQESKITTTTKRRSIKLIRPPISKAAEIWKSFDTKPPTSDDASGSNNPSYGFSLDGIDEREPDSIEYPKLSVSSSFTSQVTDHGRQPDFNFDESVATNADTSMLPSLPNVDANGGTVSEADLTRVEQSGSLSKNVLQKKKASNPPKQSTRCIMPLLEGDGSDSDFPDIKDICSQPLPRREKTTPVRRSKVKPPVEADVAEDSENSSKRNSWRRKSLSVVQRQVSNGGEKLESHPLASQPQQPVPSSQRASQYSAPSQIIDLISSEEDESESSVPKVPTLKKFRDIGAEDGNQYSKGRASKSPKRTPKARRGSDVRLKVSSQASNKGRKQTYAK